MNTNVDSNQVHTLSPLDGRYKEASKDLAVIWSEHTLIKRRCTAELVFLSFLLSKKILPLSIDTKKLVRLIETDAWIDTQAVKDIEKKTHHDVKAIEYYLQNVLKDNSLPLLPYIHIGLTSEDVNSLVLASCLTDSVTLLASTLHSLLLELLLFTRKTTDVVMLARTHGQPAVPTTLGKEMLVFLVRLAKEFNNLRSWKAEVKWGGAVGNHNALHFAFPNYDWVTLHTEFINSQGFVYNPYTTQVLPAENYSVLFQILERINGVVLDFSQDMWRYCSDGYLTNEVTRGEVGSSTMPQKVNPIHFENAEGNVQLANGLLELFVRKLPVSRLQRDLSDSTVKRNIGVAFGYCNLAYRSCLQGLLRITPNINGIEEDLQHHPEVIAEGLQTALRAAGINDAYEKFSTLSKGKMITRANLVTAIQELALPINLKEKLSALDCQSYHGATDALTASGIAYVESILSSHTSKGDIL